MSLALRIAPLSASCGEHELVAYVRRGDDRAFEELYSRYRTRIGAYVLRMVRDHGRAEDVTQEVFISALRRMRETERPIAFKPWIYEIAKNACIDDSRRGGRAKEVPLDPDDAADAVGSLGAVSLETAVESRQQLEDLRGAFGCLSESHHKILVMRELEGLSYQEIGERLGMSRPVVESTLFRARRRLGEEYEELVSGRRCEHVQAVVTSSSQPRSLGIRERRRLARHLAHCQPCRRQARLARFEDTLLQPGRIAAKVAALLPFPWWRLRGATRSTLAQATDAAAGSAGLGRAAAALAAVALTGAGGGLIVTPPGTSPARSPAAGVSTTRSAEATTTLASPTVTVMTLGGSPFGPVGVTRPGGTSRTPQRAALSRPGSNTASVPTAHNPAEIWTPVAIPTPPPSAPRPVHVAEPPPAAPGLPVAAPTPRLPSAPDAPRPLPALPMPPIPNVGTPTAPTDAPAAPSALVLPSVAKVALPGNG